MVIFYPGVVGDLGNHRQIPRPNDPDVEVIEKTNAQSHILTLQNIVRQYSNKISQRLSFTPDFVPREGSIGELDVNFNGAIDEENQNRDSYNDQS
mmetsp:Transcript_37960/g.46378  ORF Transcript_37960/g.46378 Transcript_37960/m.46378 type:complete len:95 (+) Transcript_37960:459-743(+)